MDETLPVGSFTNMFKALMRKASMSTTHDRKVVDIVKDVINQVPVYWAANFVVCPKTSGLIGIIYIWVSLVCLSPCSTVFGEDTR